ncbi:MAG: DUF2071 domain-containing protein [Acidobacteriia bacterium]|nr:DUF2071 domain-containing protein [Terriglobia bacterium]
MLAMLNYEVDPRLLQQFVPAGTELDFWQGKLFVSLVGFRFLNTRVMGIPVPFHRDFDEVNLRFYVRRLEGQEVRRGVVFVREIVPRWAIAAVARNVYNEKYVALPMRHRIEQGPFVAYSWRSRAGWSQIQIRAAGEPVLPREGSEEQFITEHYWGYAAQRGGGCMEYRVEHPSWKVWRAQQATFEGDVEELYGKELAAVVKKPPTSAFLAEGSGVAVRSGRSI